MTDTSDQLSEKVVSLFSRKPIGPEHIAQGEAIASHMTAPLPAKAEPLIDQKSVQTLNTVIEDVLKGDCSGVCIFATGPRGLPRFYLSFVEGRDPQAEAARYIGLNRLFEGIIEQVVYNGITIEDDEQVPDGSG